MKNKQQKTNLHERAMRETDPESFLDMGQMELDTMDTIISFTGYVYNEQPDLWYVN